MRKLLTVIIAVTSLGASYAFGDASFQGIGGARPGGGARATGISANGLVVIGVGWGTGLFWGLYWTEEGGLKGLPAVRRDIFRSCAVGDLSSDGGIMVGVSWYPTYPNEACIWVSPEYNVQGLGYQPSGASGVSADGSVVIGTGGPTGAFRWTGATGVLALGDSVSSAAAISDDGTVIVGQVGQEAFRWTAGTGMVGLGIVPGFTSSNATHVSADGSVVAGTCNPGSGGQEIFRWTGSTGLEGLGVIPGTYGSQINDMTSDGAVIVGRCNVFTGSSKAFRWTAATERLVAPVARTPAVACRRHRAV